MLLMLLLMGITLSLATDAPERHTTLGRLRALGLPRRDARRVLLGELVAPMLVAGIVGVAVGVLASRLGLRELSLVRLTGNASDPPPVVLWWAVLIVPILLTWVAGLALLEDRRARRSSLAGRVRG
jgi:putative ABC transport system permease protein